MKDFTDQDLDGLLTGLEGLGYSSQIDVYKKKELALLEFIGECNQKYREILAPILNNPSLSLSLPAIQPQASRFDIDQTIFGITELRDRVTKERDALAKMFREVIEEKIEELKKILPGKDRTVKKDRDAKWVIELRSLSRKAGSLENAFFGSTYNSLTILQNRKKELEKKEIEENIKERKVKEAIWAKEYLIKAEIALFTPEVIRTLSSEVAVEMAHKLIQNKYEKENDTSDAKCYCNETYNGNRHYHFVETTWDGNEIRAYLSAETY